jgi:NADH-quinone oxidoreductase subunit L
MGGLKKVMPWTRFAFLAGALALVGVPPFAGFFSKDSILAAALDRGWYGETLWAAGLAGVFLTGLYTFRLYYVVFAGEPSAFVREHAGAHGHREGPFSMTAPVAFLAVLSIIGGWIQFAGIWTPVSDFLRPVAEPLVGASGTQEAVSSVLAVALGLAGVALAGWIYAAGEARVPRLAFWRDVLEHKFYFDELYDLLFYRPAALTARLWTRLIEGPLVGGSVAGVALGARQLGQRVTQVQTGLVRTYALALAGSLAILAVVFVSVR